MSLNTLFLNYFFAVKTEIIAINFKQISQNNSTVTLGVKQEKVSAFCHDFYCRLFLALFQYIAFRFTYIKRTTLTVSPIRSKFVCKSILSLITLDAYNN